MEKGDPVQLVDEKISKHAHDADAAMKAFEGYEGQTLELSEETRKRLLRKIDLRLMPACIPPSFSPCFHFPFFCV